MNNELKVLSELSHKLKSTNSSNEKKEILQQYPQCGTLLSVIYNPYKLFGITSKQLKKHSDLIASENDLEKLTSNNIFELLDILSSRKVTGHAAIKIVNKFIEKNEEFSELIYDIIDKDLKTRANAKLINKVFNGCVPEFSVVLAKAYDEKTSKKITFDGSWVVSRKLDGCRVITMVDSEGNSKFYSRSGKEFHTLDKIKTDIKNNTTLRNIVMDGEVCIMDASGNEDFSKIVSLIKKKDYTIEEPKLIIFDTMTPEDFFSKKSNTTLIERKSLFGDIRKCEFIRYIESEQVVSEEIFDAWVKAFHDNGWEGLMLRKNVNYSGKRTADLLKYKEMIDAEFKVVDIETGIIRVIVDKEEVEEETMTNVVIDFSEHGGDIVSIGSGFSLEERRTFFKNPELIIGHSITVQYFGISQDKNGKKSLRFPVFKTCYDQPRDY